MGLFFYCFISMHNDYIYNIYYIYIIPYYIYIYICTHIHTYNCRSACHSPLMHGNLIILLSGIFIIWFNNISKIARFSRWLSGNESSCQCRRCRRWRFNSWARKIPWRSKCNPFQYSCLENSMDSGTWQVHVHGVHV